MSKLSKDDLEAIANFRKRKTNGELSSKFFYEPKDAVETVKKDLCKRFNLICEDFDVNLSALKDGASSG